MNQSYFNINNSILSPNKKYPKLVYKESLSTRDSLIEDIENKKSFDLNYLIEDKKDYEIKIKHEKSKPKLTDNLNENRKKLFSRNRMSLEGNDLEDNLNDSILKSKSILDSLTSGNKSTRKNSILNNNTNNLNVINYISPISNRKDNILLDKVKEKYESTVNNDTSKMESIIISPNEIDDNNESKNESSIFENEIFALDILEKAYKIKPILIPEKKEKKSEGFFGFFRIFKTCG